MKNNWNEIKPKFGDLIENGWASDNNPQKISVYIKTNYHKGRINHGKYFNLTDMKGDFWELPNDKESRSKIVGNIIDKKIEENKKEVIEIARDIWRDMRDNPDCRYVDFKKDKVFDETEGTNLECFREGVFDFFKKLENKLKGN